MTTAESQPEPARRERKGQEGVEGPAGLCRGEGGGAGAGAAPGFHLRRHHSPPVLAAEGALLCSALPCLVGALSVHRKAMA